MPIFLETERLILKTSDALDLNHVLMLLQDSAIIQYDTVRTNAEIQNFLQNAIAYQKKYGFGFCSVFEKESGEFIGQAGIFHVCFDEHEKDLEIGYRLHQRFWGQGYATEITRALINWAFTVLSISKLVAFVHPENKRSARVLKKAGFMFIGKKHYRNKEVDYFEVYKSDAIEVVSFDPDWLIQGQAEIKVLTNTLPQNMVLDIQHVGSTSIPNIKSKPIIDIAIAVTSVQEIKTVAIAALEKLNYSYWDENPDKESMFFVKGMPPFGERRTHHVHISEPTHRKWQERIIFRDYLLSHPEAVTAYEKLKVELANQYTYDREKYTDAKKEFIKAILIKAQYK